MVAVVVAVTIGGYFKLQALANQGHSVHAAVCVFRADLEKRVETSKQFLKEHPNGIPGIPASLIKNSIENIQKTIDSLKRLDCKE